MFNIFELLWNFNDYLLSRCGPCPPAYTGDGERCTRVMNHCERSPCGHGTSCHPHQEHPYFRCHGCLPGFVLVGSECRDVDECDLHNPCGPQQECKNTPGSYRCDRPTWNNYQKFHITIISMSTQNYPRMLCESNKKK